MAEQRVLLIVGGGIAAYKALELVNLIDPGAVAASKLEDAKDKAGASTW